ncbi:hypothetical protein [Halomarina ordinaria]|uniref:Multidrug transporter n=1 Tax=Halomarina ordinaria TaxID=3033939 RepID=A0ABD5UFD5_9EURY|nr:hypothetical protein [Halomarina sp. PSRA2]
MPGRSSRSPTLQWVGLAAFVVALVGFVVFGWRFGGESDTFPFALGVAVAVLALGWTLRR